MSYLTPSLPCPASPYVTLPCHTLIYHTITYHSLSYNLPHLTSRRFALPLIRPTLARQFFSELLPRSIAAITTRPNGLEATGLETSGLKTNGLKTKGLNSNGVKTYYDLNISGLKTGLKTNSLNTYGLNIDGLKTNGLNIGFLTE